MEPDLADDMRLLAMRIGRLEARLLAMWDAVALLALLCAVLTPLAIFAVWR